MFGNLLMAASAVVACSGDGADNPSTTDYFATHTTYISATGTISASSERVGLEVWRIVNDSPPEDLQGLSSSTPTVEIDYDLVTPQIFNKYTITPRYGGGFIFERLPKDWTLKGSNDGGATFDILDTVVGEASWSAGVKNTYTCVNNTSYDLYQIDVTLNNGASGNVDIGEIEMIVSQCA